MRERGLKYGPAQGAWTAQFKSLPMRERGLKLPVPLPVVGAFEVAPHAGAWIEITGRGTCRHPRQSLPMRERGLKSSLNLTWGRR